MEELNNPSTEDVMDAIKELQRKVGDVTNQFNQEEEVLALLDSVKGKLDFDDDGGKLEELINNWKDSLQERRDRLAAIFER
jgi:hypothetical protein